MLGKRLGVAEYDRLHKPSKVVLRGSPDGVAAQRLVVVLVGAPAVSTSPRIEIPVELEIAFVFAAVGQPNLDGNAAGAAPRDDVLAQRPVSDAVFELA